MPSAGDGGKAKVVESMFVKISCRQRFFPGGCLPVTQAEEALSWMELAGCLSVGD